VVFFHDQDLSNEQLHAFVGNFGIPAPEPFAEPAMRPADPVSASCRWGRHKAAVENMLRERDQCHA
jgi:hypothetical protein